MKAPQILGEAARALAMIPLFVLPFTILVVLASSKSGDLQSLRCADHHPIRTGDERKRNRFARDDKELGPQLGAKQLPGERPRETAET